MSTPVTLIPGDGIGPEVTAAVERVLAAAGANVTWDRQTAGQAALEQHGDPLPQATLESIGRTRVALKGPLATPVGGGYRSVNVALRQTFDLYANVRPARTLLPGGRFEDVDIVLVRENTEGLYSGIEHYVRVGDDRRAAAESLAVITRHGSERAVRHAFEHAVRHGRERVTLVHKANILKLSQGLFLEVGREVAREYVGRVRFDERIVDAMAMDLVTAPERVDVIVTTNLFGDILSDLVSGLVGGLGLTPGANIGEDAAVFEAVHGTAPDLAGRDLANPGALAARGLHAPRSHRPGAGRRKDPRRLRVHGPERGGRTADLGGDAGTTAFTDALRAAL
jgi:isocitrate dehydrogenase (NAD+)